MKQVSKKVHGRFTGIANRLQLKSFEVKLLFALMLLMTLRLLVIIGEIVKHF